MTDAALSLLVLTICCASAALGRAALLRLPEAHRSRDTMAFAQTTSSLLVTFTALVLGLLLTSVNADFKKTDADLHAFAATMIRLNGELVDYGPAARDIRDELRRYTASAIASTWPGEARPAGVYPAAVAHGTDFDAVNLGAMLDDAAAKIRRLEAPTPDLATLRSALHDRVSALRDQRWTLIGEANSLVTPSLFVMMTFWIAVIFLGFGLTAPHNATAAALVVLVALGVASAIFMILELDGPLDGLIMVSSEPLRHALVHIDGGLGPL